MKRRRTRVVWISLWIALCIFGPHAFAQIEQRGAFSSPLPQPPPTPAIGKGVLGGTVVNAKTREPLRKASVMLNGPNMQLSAMTDASGAFTFRALPEGAYFVTASRDGFFYNPSGNRSQIQLANEEEKHDLTLKLIPGAVLSGRVLDEDDEPLANCQVQAIRFDPHSARRSMMGQNGGAGDDLGKYRISGLMAGHYSLRATCGETFPAPHGFLKRGDPMAPVEGFATTTYGAGDTASAASGLLVSAGAEMSALDFHMKRIPLYIITGALSGVDAGLLQSAQISLTSHESSDGEDMQVGAQIEGKGHFTLRNVPAGSYELTALVLNGETAFEAHQTVETGKTAITEANIKLVPAAVLQGRIDSDDSTVNYENWQLSLAPVANYRGPYPNAKVEKDGSFEFKAILPGQFRLNIPPVGYVKSFSIGGREMQPTEFQISGPGTGPIHIQISTKMAKLEVALSPAPADGQPVAGILFNGDEPGMVDQRNISMSYANGRLSFQSAVPGKYRMIVVETVNPWQVMNQPGVLKALEDRSVSVEIAEGADKQISAGVVSAEDLQKALDEVE